jgi:hypothetical protein
MIPANHRRAASTSGLLTGVLAILVLAPTLAIAQTVPDREAREVEAKRACLANRPEQGIDVLAGLYTETNDPTYIYNQGRCFEQNGRAQEAANRFREYLRKTPNLPEDERTQVQARIGDLEQQARQSASPAAGAAAATGSSGEPAAAEAVTASASADNTDQGTDAIRSQRLRVAGIATGAVGVAALGGGLFMGWRAKALSDEVTTDAGKAMYSRGKDESGQLAETLQWIGYGVGGAALIGGALLYYVGTAHKDAPATTTTAALAPLLGPGLGGASLHVRF